MTGRPWYKRYPSDFLHGTMGLSCEEKGAYGVALDLMYERGGPIPNDGVWIARMCGCSARKWSQTLLPALIAVGKLHLTEDGKVSNERMEFETQRSDERSEAAREGGRKGGHEKASRAAHAKIISDLSQVYPPDKSEINGTIVNENNTPVLPLSETQRLREESKLAQARERVSPRDHAEAALKYAPDQVKLYPDGRIGANGWDLEGVANRVFYAARVDPSQWKGDLKPLIRWLWAENDPDLIVRAIEDFMAKVGERPRDFAQFDNWVAAARKRQITAGRSD
jgi:uncharacterized protein YdaU (DUF1376 family)